MTTNAPKHAQWGAYGDISFKGLFTPTQYSDSRRFSLQGQKLVSGYPSFQFFGEEERTFQLSIYVHNAFADLTMVSQTLDEMATGGVIRSLVIGNAVKGTFGIKAMSAQQELTYEEGQLVGYMQNLTLVEVKL